jgi:hypothetical protein
LNRKEKQKPFIPPHETRHGTIFYAVLQQPENIYLSHRPFKNEFFSGFRQKKVGPK